MAVEVADGFHLPEPASGLAGNIEVDWPGRRTYLLPPLSQAAHAGQLDRNRSSSGVPPAPKQLGTMGTAITMGSRGGD